MTSSSPLTWDQLSKLFSVVICIDDNARVVYASDTPRQYIPLLGETSDFFDIFILLRPSGARDIATIREHSDSLFLMKARDNRFALRGQMLQTQRDGQSVMCFCGAPWLFWMNSNCPDVKLGMGDFSTQDSQLDQLFLMTTEQRMVSDLEKLNSDLKGAKRDAERAQETKNALFARMSHEMRTPLNGVVSALSLLADQPLSSDAQKLLNLAHSSSRNLLHVINYVLDISKIEAGDDNLERTLFDLRGLLKMVTDIVRARAVEKNIDLLWRQSTQLGQMYVADKAKLRQCLLNLITNAIKFTESGSITVRALPSVLGQSSNLRFEVEDTGIGITEADQKRIFEPFWTGSDDTPEIEKGTGLGLDIVRRNVEIMGGSIGVISREGKGSLFWFEVPVEASDEEPTEADQLPAVGGAVPARFKGSVLLVDDNGTNLLLGRMILQSLGVDVVEAEDGASAVKQARDGKFDLVLMDISMPGMDGVEATSQIRRFLSQAELPIVALTAYASNDEKDRCIQAGMNDYLTKPIVRDRLAEQLNLWLATETEVPDAPAAATFPDDPFDDDTPALAVDVLEGLRRQIGNDNLGTVLDQFESEVRTRWAALGKAFEARDMTTMTREAHTLASTCRSLGLIAAGDHFSTVENEMRDTLNAPRDGLSHSNVLLQRGLDALKAFRENPA